MPIHCERCRNKSTFHLVRTRRWLTILSTPIIPLQLRKYYLTCEICELSYPLHRQKVPTVKKMRDKAAELRSGRLTESEYLDEVDALSEELTSWDFHNPKESLAPDTDDLPDRGFD